MYTEIATDFNLKTDTPQLVIDILSYLTNLKDQSTELPEHALFQTTRWRSLFMGGSAYFDTNYASLVHDGVSYHLKTCANLKNYDGEIDLFWDFVTPYIDAIPGEHLGHMHYEENETPLHIVFIGEGKLEFIQAEHEPQGEEDDY